MSDNLVPPPPPSDVVETSSAAAPRSRSPFSWFLNILGIVFVLGSITLNFILLIVVIAQAASADANTRVATNIIKKGNTSQTVAVYHLEDVVAPESARAFADFHKAVIKDNKVKAIVLRVVSPGGRVTSSDQIHRMVTELRKAGKTVVVSMGGVAASGGYFISAPAHEIMAEPTTITGSIGVLMTYFVFEDAMGKLGIDSVVIKSTHAEPWKDAGSPFRKLSPREREYLLTILDEYQQQFEEVVRAGRGDRLKTRTNTLSRVVGEGEAATVEEITETEPFNGKIYLPTAAKELGLIDSIGYRADAIDRAAELANLTKPHVVRFSRKKSAFELLFGAKAPEIESIGPKAIRAYGTPTFEMIWRVQ